MSDGFFRTLGVTPVLGRDFYAGEDLPAAPRTVLLSYAAWQKRFGGKDAMCGPDGDARWRSVHHHRRAAAGVSIRSRGAARVLDRASRFRATATSRRSCHNLSTE